MDPNFQTGMKFITYSSLGGFSILSQRNWEEAKQIAHYLQKCLMMNSTSDRLNDPLHLADATNEMKKWVEEYNPIYWGHVYDSIFSEENQQRYNRAIEFTEKLNKKYSTSFTID